MDEVQEGAWRVTRNDWSAFIRRIGPDGKRQSSEQSVKSRITKWNTASFFRTALSNTFTSLATLYWTHPARYCNSWVARRTSPRASGREKRCGEARITWRKRRG